MFHVNTHILTQFFEPLRMTLLNVLLPEMLALEQLCALRDLTAPLGFVLLFDIAGEFVLDGLLQRFATELADVNILWLKQLQQLLFIGFNRVVVGSSCSAA